MRKKRRRIEIKKEEKKNKSSHNKINKNRIDLNHLKECLHYDSETGHLFWKERPESHFKPGNTSSKANCKGWNKKYAGKKISTLDKKGYIIVTIDEVRYLGHRIAYYIHHGYMPESLIDHKNRIKNNNWISNLRESNKKRNAINSEKPLNNTSGVKGVTFFKRDKKWQAQIKVNQKNIYLGIFVVFEDAVMARWRGEKKYKFSNFCSSSSSYNYLKNKGLI